MVKNIKGITIEIGGNAEKLEKSLGDVYSKGKNLTKEMKEVDKALRFNPKNIELVSQKQKVLTEQVETTRKRLDELKSAQEQVTQQYKNGEIDAGQYRAFQREIAETESILKTYKRKLSDVSDGHKILGDKLDKVSGKLKNVGEKMKDIGGGLSTKVTAPILAMGGLLANQAADIESGQTRIQNAMGLTGDKAEEIAGVAKDVYSGAWGDSMADVEQAIIQVNEQLGTFDDPKMLENVTIKALQLEDVFGMDINESLRGVNSLMETYGLTADEAFDYMTVGAQNGLDKTDELGDNLAEYSTLFEENGYSAEEMFDIIQAGLDGGAYNLDKVNDIVKEFGIRVGDGTIKDAVSEMGGEWQEIYDGWEAGGGTNKELFEKMAQNLADIEDPQERQLALTEIWGSLGEDAGYKIIAAMGEVEGQYDNVNGAMDTTIENTDATFGARMQSLVRSFATSFEPLGLELLDLAETYLPKLNEKVEQLTGWLQSLDEEQMNNIIQIGLMAAAIGPAIVIFGSLANGVSRIVSLGAMLATNWGTIQAAGSALAGGLSTTIGFLFSPAGAILVGIAAVIAGGVWLYKNWDTVKEKAAQLKEWVSLKWTELTNATVGKFTEMKDSMNNKITEAKNSVVNRATEMKNNFVNRAVEMKNSAINKFTELKTGTINKFNEVKNSITSKITEARNNVTNKATEMKNNFINKTIELKTGAVNKFNEVKTGITGKISEAVRTVKNKFSEVYENIMGPVRRARDAVKTVIEKIKGFFDFTFELPHIPKPSFGITPGGWKIGDLLKGSIPKLNINWNAEGGIMTRPTIFGASGGSLMAGGEYRTGGEAILPLNRLPQMMAEALERANMGQSQTNVIQVYLGEEDVTDLITDRVDRNLYNKKQRIRRGG